MKNKHVIVGLMFLIGILGIQCSKKAPEKREYDSYKVQKKDLIRFVEASGSVTAEQSVDVYSPIKGTVERMLVEEGDYVKKGQKIAIVSSSTRNSFLDAARQKGKEELNYWKQQMKPAVVYAPISGRMLVVRYQGGELIRGWMAQIYTDMHVVSEVDEADITKVVKGQKVKVNFDVDDESYVYGNVKKITLKSSSRNGINVYPVEISFSKDEIKNLPFDVRIGMTVSLEFVIEEKKGVLAIDSSAVVGATDKEVKVLNDQLQNITLKLGKAYGSWIEVADGAKEGTIVKVEKFVNQDGQEKKIPFLFDKK